MRLQPLLDSVEANVRVGPPRSQAEQPRIARHLSCQANQSGLLQASFCIGVTPSQDRAGMLLSSAADLLGLLVNCQVNQALHCKAKGLGQALKPAYSKVQPVHMEHAARR